MRRIIAVSTLVAFLCVVLVSTAFAQAQTTTSATPKNFGQTVKKERQEINAKRKALQREFKAKKKEQKAEFKAKKKELKQEFKTKKQELKQNFKTQKQQLKTPTATP